MRLSETEVNVPFSAWTSVAKYSFLKKPLVTRMRRLGGECTLESGGCPREARQLAVSLFGNTQIGKMRNTCEHQRVSDG